MNRRNTVMTVGDLFSGAGGFSEGFRQAGFKILWSVDNWKPAVDTYRHNHPGTRVYSEDILRLKSERLERVDVVIGSPPCTHFSLANRGGGGDKAAGFRLVRRFLEIVEDLQPKYWIMENVPSLLPTLESRLKDNVIRLKNGRLRIPEHSILSAADYGTPQLRRRLFSGDYPIPSRQRDAEERNWTNLGDVLRKLPDPCCSASEDKTCIDTLYDLEIPLSNLRDHFEDTNRLLANDDIVRSKRLKLQNPVYGPMAWPDDLDRPSRTITATRTKASRATIVVKCPHHTTKKYRTLTLRECACLQGFPLNYQFWADSMSKKNTLVGNAVPPPLARAMAHAILAQEGLEIPSKPLLNKSTSIADAIRARPARKYRYPLSRRFRGYVQADWSPKCRVELDNAGFSTKKGSVDYANKRTWVTRLYLGYAKEYRCYELDYDAVSRIVRKSYGIVETAKAKSHLEALLEDARDSFSGWLPDSVALQRRWAARTKKGVSPEHVLNRVDWLVGRHLPGKDWRDVNVPKKTLSSSIRSYMISKGLDANANPPLDLPVRTLASALVLALACRSINHVKNSDRPQVSGSSS